MNAEAVLDAQCLKVKGRRNLLGLERVLVEDDDMMIVSAGGAVLDDVGQAPDAAVDENAVRRAAHHHKVGGRLVARRNGQPVVGGDRAGLEGMPLVYE